MNARRQTTSFNFRKTTNYIFSYTKFPVIEINVGENFKIM